MTYDSRRCPRPHSIVPAGGRQTATAQAGSPRCCAARSVRAKAFRWCADE